MPAAPGRESEGQSISVSSGPSESRGGGGRCYRSQVRTIALANPTP